MGRERAPQCPTCGSKSSKAATDRSQVVGDEQWRGYHCLDCDERYIVIRRVVTVAEALRPDMEANRL